MKYFFITLLIVFLFSGCSVTPRQESTASVLLAEFHVWHGLSSHRFPPYDSRDPDVIAFQIDKAKAMGISGFIVDWYGPKSNVANDEEREFQDQAVSRLMEQAEARDFTIALLYDEGTVRSAETLKANYQPRVESDLDYACGYFLSKAYLRVRNKPALFVFPYDDVDIEIDWGEVRQSLDAQVTLIDKDPDPLDITLHDSYFDGFFAWVTATNGAWDPGGLEWGEEYLNWFYHVMQSDEYKKKVMVGGVWPGFDSMLASWDPGRYMARCGTETYDTTMMLAKQADSPYILIETWNDFEEGTDIEYGVEMIVEMEDDSTAILIRSSPLKVLWNPCRTAPVLQVYKDGEVSETEIHTSGSYIALDSGYVYELKLWASDLPAPGWISRWIVTRHEDEAPGVMPVTVEF